MAHVSSVTECSKLLVQPDVEPRTERPILYTIVPVLELSLSEWVKTILFQRSIFPETCCCVNFRRSLNEYSASVYNCRTSSLPVARHLYFALPLLILISCVDRHALKLPKGVQLAQRNRALFTDYCSVFLNFDRSPVLFAN